MELRDYPATKLSEVPKKFHKEILRELKGLDPEIWVHIRVVYDYRGGKNGGPALWYHISVMEDEAEVINYYNSGGVWNYTSLKEFLSG